MTEKIVAVFLWLFMALDHLMFGEWEYFSKIGRASMWAGSVMAARRARG